MKLLSFRIAGREAFGAVVDDGVVDLSNWRADVRTLADYIACGAYLDAAEHVEGRPVIAALEEIEYLPVIPRAEKIVCAVRNYLDHHNEAVAAGLNRDLSEFPPIFLRVWRSQVAHNQPIVKPHCSDTLDWEGELAVIIGVGGRDIAEADAWNHVAGYSVYNDASVREWQFHAKQIAAGKNFEGTGAFGPWMVTADEIAPGRPLKLLTRLNGEVVQSSDTSHLIFSVPQLIAYASTIFTLVPGDVIVTGTPSGVGLGRKPPRYMNPGDVVEVEIESVGTLRNLVVEQD
ncbi:fumarylacetoacetate hydrolase family protein [Paraburkholderia susongensis]|uniref:2-keto-4-pentenoate hydratase/2-oxohepta-3-ene-1,7-dioic acid hydratase (Catechol pathway) n=1 Tax=Paraburkholderia susongensis TaxID=1515439 RepID=A0A1X7M2M0_9BURK|nr:fumarylacetoacetate hydrolase family protein [Paraburkholderia susongensis]SMG59619.1 2-keto-4-pentenoate hydratase/2-oxohepta-3-ene-1,7-dioic acid hydratase (catechol pathway) [Paraburkholderia susongensis]